MRVGHAAVVFALSAVFLTSFAAAQFQNPIQAAKDAYKNAKQQSQQQKPPAQQPEQQQTQVASAAAPSSGAAAQGQAPGPGPANLDIIGIKLGASMNDALQALKVDNPKLKITPTAFKYVGFNDPLTLQVDAKDIPATMNEQVTRASETVDLMFTTPPGDPEVWLIYRDYEFPTSQKPSSQTVMDALRKKYGPETIPPGSPVGEQTLTWVFDPQGKLITAGGQQLNTTCESVFGGAGDPIAGNSAIVSPDIPQWPQQCSSIIVLTAQIHLVQIAPGQFATPQFTVKLVDGGRYRKALAATRATIAAAVKAQQDKKMQQVNQVGAPKL